MDWVLEHWQNGLLAETVDPSLRKDYNLDEACLALKLGLLCSHPFVSARPTMRQVMQYLEGDAAIPELTPTHFSFTMQALTRQDEGFESPSSMLDPPLLTTSMGTFSSLSGGR
jgi:hypothetical protein